jgi:acetyl esterase/lipase
VLRANNFLPLLRRTALLTSSPAQLSSPIMEKRGAILLVAALLQGGRVLGDPAQVEIWPPGLSPLPGEGDYACGPESVQTRQYTNISDRVYYNVSRPSLWPYIVPGSGAAVVVAPGGGYSHMNWDDEGTRVALRLNLMGVSALVLKYRVPARPQGRELPPFAAQLMDAQRAMGVARLRARQGAWAFNASRLGFAGFSAGGHLTAAVSTHWHARLYERVDAADDEPCRPDFSLLIYPWMLLQNNNRTSGQLAPEFIVNASHPPAFLAQNMDDDTAFPEGTMLYARTLVEAGAPSPTVHLYPRGGHGFGICSEVNPARFAPVNAFQACCDWPSHAQRFLQELDYAPGWPANVSICTREELYPTPPMPQ